MEPTEPTAADPAVAAAAATASTPPPPAADTPPAEAPTPPAPSHPWDADRDSYFTDPDARGAFDKYMSEKQSPYVAKLEGERADLQQKALLFDQLEADPDSTLVEVIGELYPDATDDAVRAFIEGLGKDPDAAATAAQTKAVTAAALSDEDKQAVEWAKGQAKAAADQAAMDEYLADAKPIMEANKDIPAALFHRYVATNGGDFERAVAVYRAENAPPEKPAGPPAPSTLKGGGTANTASPAATSDPSADFDRAAEGFWNSMRK